jgi:hypothetical protein
MPSPEYAEAASITKSQVLTEREAGREIQADSANVIRRYFDRYYTDGDLNENLAEARRGIAVKFATVASEFEMISSRNLDVFVPDDSEARQAIAELRERGRLDRELRGRLRRHTVGLSPWEFSEARGVLEELAPGSDIWIAVDGAYSAEVGLMNVIPPTETIL